MSTDANAPPAAEAPWWAGLPEPQATCDTIENSEVMQLLEKTLAEPRHADRRFLLVDVRRNDWDGGTIATSINLPAQSFHLTRPVVYQLCKQASIEKIIFYCGMQFWRAHVALLTLSRKLWWTRHQNGALDAGLPKRGWRQ